MDKRSMIGLLLIGALLIADEAEPVLRPDKAAAGIDCGCADFRVFLFLKLEFADSAGGADRAAQSAGLVAAGKARIKPRRPDAADTGLKQAGLQRIGWADLHALAAADAGSLKSRLGQCSRRPDEAVRVAFCRHIFFDRKSGKGPGCRRSQKTPALSIRQRRRGRGITKGYGLHRADGCACGAINAFLGPVLTGLLADGAGGAGRSALHTGSAAACYPPPE
mgnify:CR=1 FL=1